MTAGSAPKAVDKHERINLMDGVPQVNVSYRQLKKLTPKQRLRYIGSSVLTANVSAFARGAVLRKLVDYAFNALLPATPTTKTWQNTLHNVINLNELGNVLNSVVVFEPEEAGDSLVDWSAPRRVATAVMELLSPYFDAQTIEFNTYSGYVYDGLLVRDLVDTLSNLHEKTARMCNISMVYMETYEQTEKSKSHLFVFDLNLKRYALMVVSSSAKQGLFEYTDSTLTFYEARSSCDTGIHLVIDNLKKIVRANFVARLVPEQNMLELEDYSTKIVTRSKSYQRIPNLDIDEITKSITYAMEHKKRLVIVVVGDGGLGKTAAVHTILNRFPSVPACIVTPSAIREDTHNVKSIFDTLSAFDCLAVFDDFDGFNVKSKNDVVTEFLRQFSGDSGYNGVALVTVNDPSQVNPLLIDRPGRMDSLYLMGYIDTVEDVELILNQHFGERDYSGYREVLQKMIDLHFSNSRMIRAVEFAEEQGGLTPESLAVAVDRVHEFEKIAKSSTVRGRLVLGDNPDVDDCNKEVVEDVKCGATPRSGNLRMVASSIDLDDTPETCDEG